MNFDKRKEMKKFVERLVEADVVTPRNCDWAAPSILVNREDGICRLVEDHRGINKQKENNMLVFQELLISSMLWKKVCSS